MFRLGLGLLGEELVEALTQTGNVGDEMTQVVEVLLVRRLRQPQTDVTVDGVLAVEVLLETFPVTFLVEFGVIAQTVLNGAADDNVDVDVPVGLGDDLSVETAGRSTASFMILIFSGGNHFFNRESAARIFPPVM